MTTAIVLAGGLGTRLRSAVPDLPKPMAPIRGRPFLEYQLDYWSIQGVTRFIVSVGYLHESIVGHFGDSYKGIPLDFVIEESPLGTGGALLAASRKLNDASPFLLLNGDTYFSVPLKALDEFAHARDADWCFSLFRTGEEGRYMTLETNPQGQIFALNSGAGRVGDLANGGVYWVQPRVLAGHVLSPGEVVSLESDILPAALASGQRLFGVECDGAFIDIGVPHDYHRAATFLAIT